MKLAYYEIMINMKLAYNEIMKLAYNEIGL